MSSDELPVGDKIFVSSKRASQISTYAQDYIGQLARSGQIEAKRVGGLWYVDMDSLETYKKGSEVPNSLEPREIKNQDQETDTLVSFDGKDYISANRASKLTGYNQDYVGQLARSGKILSRQIGNRWYVDRDGILAHKKEKDDLLAAVQSASVGIKPLETKAPLPMREDAEIPNDPGPLLKYVQEDFVDLNSLIPERRVEDDQYRFTAPPRQFENRYESTQKLQIPIHKAKRDLTPDESYTSIDLRRSRFSSVKAIPRAQNRNRSLISLKIGLSIVALGITLSVGVLYLKFSSTENNQVINSAMSAALSSAPMQVFSAIADKIENLISPGLVYQRGN